jgi:hypothetical protein
MKWQASKLEKDQIETIKVGKLCNFSTVHRISQKFANLIFLFVLDFVTSQCDVKSFYSTNFFELSLTSHRHRHSSQVNTG